MWVLSSNLFITLLACVILVVGYAEYLDTVDMSLLFYVLCLVFLTPSLLFWIFWGVKSKNRPSFMFVLVGLLFASLEFIFISYVYARYLLATDVSLYIELLQSSVWSYRVASELLVFMVVFCWIYYRVIYGTDTGGAVGESLRILIIEDDKDLSEIMVKTLTSLSGFTIDRAYDYETALSLFTPHKYVCTVVDLNLGRSSKEGIDLAYKFRKMDEDVYIAVVSGYFEEMFNDKLFQSMDDFMRKPFELDVFKIKVFLWTIKYRKRLFMKRLIEGSDFKVKNDILEELDRRISDIYSTGEKKGLYYGTDLP